MKELAVVLDKYITIEKYTTITTPNGFDEPKWIPYKKVWSSVNNLFGKEFYAAKAIQEEKTIEFKIRYNKLFKNLNSKYYRICWEKKTFNITFIDNIKYANRWIIIKAIEEN